MTQTEFLPVQSTLPRQDEVFLAQNPVRNIDHIKRRHHKRGYVDTLNVTMEDDVRYRVYSAEPKERITDTPMTMALPWFTKNEGLNRRMMYHIAGQGIPVDVVTVEQNLSYLPHLGKSAHNQLEISRQTAALYERNDDEIYVNGVSRGAMIGFALNAFAKAHGKEVLYSDLLVPCYPERLNIIRDALTYVALPKHELSSIAAFRSLPVKLMAKYPGTLDISPRGIVQHIKSIPTLTSGAAGEAALMMPNDTTAHVSVFDGDIMSQGERWRELLSDFPNITVENIAGGGHLSCASEPTYCDWAKRIDSLAFDIRGDRPLGTTALHAV